MQFLTALLGFAVAVTAGKWYDASKDVTCSAGDNGITCEHGHADDAPAIQMSGVSSVLDTRSDTGLEKRLSCGISIGPIDGCLASCFAQGYCNSYCDDVGTCHCRCYDNGAICVDTTCN